MQCLAQRFMCAIAHRLILAVFAAAQAIFFLFSNFYFYRGKLRTFMRAIAEWLFLGFTTGTPPVGAGFQFNNIGFCLRAGRFAHDVSPVKDGRSVASENR